MPAASAARPTCVLAPELSAAPNGLFWALGLARSADTWLAQSHWTLIDDAAYYARDCTLAQRLARFPEPNEAVRRWARSAQEWREARETLGLESRPGLFWPGDGRADSTVPKNGDVALIDRLSALAIGLEARTARSSRDGSVAGDVLGDCARDALALAAALGAANPIVLTRVNGGAESEPSLAARLAAADVPCRPLREGAARDQLSALILPALLAAGFAVQAEHDELALAALVITAPHALMARELEPNADPLAWNALGGEGEMRLWDDAAAIWWRPL